MPSEYRYLHIYQYISKTIGTIASRAKNFTLNIIRINNIPQIYLLTTIVFIVIADNDRRRDSDISKPINNIPAKLSVKSPVFNDIIEN